MDSNTISIIIALIGAYLLGSIPFAYIVSRLVKRVDIRQVGTRNMGAMNTIYRVGLWWGILVLLLDMAKGALAVLLARWLGVSETMQLVAGGISVVGHMFPVFLGFRGGKGGATVIGILICLMPRALPFGAAVFLIVLALTRYPTLSYSLALLCAPFVAWLVYHSGVLVVFSIALLLMVLARYAPRIIEMRTTSGNWRHVFIRKGLKDRF